MAFQQDNTKQKEVREKIVEEAKAFEKDKAILKAQLSETMRNSIDFSLLRKKLEMAKADGLTKDWYVHLDKSIQALEIWFNIK